MDMNGKVDSDRIRLRHLAGKLHREDGPAFIDTNGNKAWCYDGKFHRENGPAIERTCGDREWYVNDDRHREDGPAIEYANGEIARYLNNRKYPFDEWCKVANITEEDKLLLMLKYVR